jgi:hypothetical protein
MTLARYIQELQAAVDRLRAEALFEDTPDPYRAGAQHFADQVELIIARRLELLENWMPHLSGATRKHELHQLREAIRQINIP